MEHLVAQWPAMLYGDQKSLTKSQPPITKTNKQILKRHFVLLQKVVITSDGDPLRQDTSISGSIRPQIGRYIPKIGRPRQDWTNYLLKEAASRMGTDKFEKLVQLEKSSRVCSACGQKFEQAGEKRKRSRSRSRFH